jgi:hypothetical protein
MTEARDLASTELVPQFPSDFEDGVGYLAQEGFSSVTATMTAIAIAERTRAGTTLSRSLVYLGPTIGVLGC